MKALSILFFACLAVWAQPAPPVPSAGAAAGWDDVPDATVIAVFGDGSSMTMGDFKNLFHALPPDLQNNAQKQPEAFLHQWALMRNLAQLAKTQKLDERSPIRESLEFSSFYILMQAEMQDSLRRVNVEPAEAHQYYDEHKDKYKEVHLKAIYLSFSDRASGASSTANSSSVKLRTEDEAKALAAKLVAQLRGGADFVKLVAQYSDDAATKAKDGDFTTVYGSDNIPDQIKVTVEENTKLTIEGPDKKVVGQVAAEIRNFYPPEPYKGKGVRYVGEHVQRKEGKTVQ